MSNNNSRKSGNDSLIAIAISTALIIIGFWTAFQFVEPAPPSKISISSGSEDGAYYSFAHQYQAILSTDNIELNILSSAGSNENIQRLLNNDVDIAFVQGGSGDVANHDQLLSLGSLYYEPIWLFYQKPLTINRITDLLGKRVAIGAVGSGTRHVSQQLLEQNGIHNDNTSLLSLTGKDSSKVLLNGEIDALFMIASPKSDMIQQLLSNPKIGLMSFDRADAYTRLNPFLSRITLPQGVVDLKNNIPAKEIVLLAPTANLVIRKDFHPSLSVLLLQAATEIHQTFTIFSAKETFPTADYLEFPLSDEADRYYKKGAPFLMRFLPFGMATFIDRMVVMIIPLVALLFPLFKVGPPLYRWRIRSKIYRWYKELQAVDDRRHDQEITEKLRQNLITELERIESEVNKVKIPLSYADQVYNLLLHIDLVKKRY